MEYNIGDTIKDDNRDLTIIDKKFEKRSWLYKYRCNICGYDCCDGYHGGKPVSGQWYKDRDFEVLHKGCRCCNKRIIVPEINSIAATNPELCKYFINGDEYKYSISSPLKTTVVCPDCGELIPDKTISTIISHGACCPVCSSSRPIGERIVYAVFEYLDVNFKKEFQFDGSNKRYDFYLNDFNVICEVNGRQHYEQISGKWASVWNTIDKEVKNDKLKFDIAMKNGVSRYIVIDAIESKFDYIKKSILDSELSDILDLNSVDWDFIKHKINKDGNIKDICLYWEEHPDTSIIDMENIFHYSESMIYRFLTIGYEHGWCHRREQQKHQARPLKYNDVYFRDANKLSKYLKEYENSIVAQSTIRYKARRGDTFTYVSKEEFNRAADRGEQCVGERFKSI